MFFMNRFKNQNPKPAANRPDKRGKVLLRWLLLIPLLLVILLLFLGRLWRSMPRLAIAEISELTGCEVYTESIDFKLNGTVFIKNLVIKPYASQGPKENQGQQYDTTLLKAKNVY